MEWANAWAKGITFRRDANQDVGGFFAQVWIVAFYFFCKVRVCLL